MSETSFSPSLEEIWAYEPKTNLLKIKSWEEKGLFHGFQLGLPDLKNKDTTDWCKLQARSDLHLLKQVHGNRVVDARVDSSNQGLAEADGWFLDQDSAENVTDSSFGVLSADCAPVIIFSEQEKSSAILHSGWRGTAKNILSQGLKKFANAKNVEIAIGPSAGLCCYEFERETAERHFKHWLKAEDAYQAGNLSVKKVLEQQAIEAGISKDRIFVSQLCSICDHRFFSFRRQGKDSGRQLSFVGA